MNPRDALKLLQASGLPEDAIKKGLRRNRNDNLA